MTKDEGILRWGIPGWTFVLGFLIFALIDYFAANNPTIYTIINSALAEQEIWRTIVVALLIAAAGIPIGFLNYQIYFYLRWNSPVSKSGLLPPLIVGRKDELELMLRDLKDKDLEFDTPWRDHLLSSSTDYRGSWHYISQLLSEAFSSLDSSHTIADKHHYLLTMLHSLGASHVGFSLGFMFYLLTKWKLQQVNLIWIPIAFAIVTLTLAFLSKNDYPLQKQESKHRLSVRHSAEVFIASLFFLYFTLNPFLDQYGSFALPLLVCTFLGIYWGVVENGSREGLWLITLLLIIVTLTFRLTGILHHLSWMNWSVFLSTLIFCSISLAFLKNRQNTRDALGTLEYYEIRRFLEKRSASTQPAMTMPQNELTSSNVMRKGGRRIPPAPDRLRTRARRSHSYHHGSKRFSKSCYFEHGGTPFR